MTANGERLLAEYSADHQHPFNRAMHSVCVPLIAISLIGLLWAIPLPGVNLGVVALIALSLYYLRLGTRLGVGMLLAAGLTAAILIQAAGWDVPLWLTATVVFVVGWIGQFIGHAVEGRRPSFFRDLQFLLIGPLWALAKLYDQLGIRR
jgi:uncharacterized membrane protein YGL010W